MFQLDALFPGGTYGTVVATRYCMTIADVDGNLLTLVQESGNDVRSTQ